MNTLENNVFISYVWGGESERIVDKIDEALKKKGVKLIRDKRDLGFKRIHGKNRSWQLYYCNNQ